MVGFKNLREAIIKKIQAMIQEKMKGKISIFSLLDANEREQVIKAQQ